MFTFWVLLSIIIPIMAVYLHNKVRTIHFYFDAFAFLSVLVISNLIAATVFHLLREDALYMTSIHGLFVNGYFLSCGVYLTFYALYRILLNFRM